MRVIMLNNIVLFHRKQAGLSRQALADLAGVSPTVIYHLENGKETLQWNIVDFVDLCKRWGQVCYSGCVLIIHGKLITHKSKHNPTFFSVNRIGVQNLLKQQKMR